MARCKSCGAKIRFIKTIGGKSMLVNEEAVYYKYKLGAKDRVVTPNGEVLPCIIYDAEKDDLSQAEGWGYLPHFATCPNADEYRKRGR